MRDLRERWIHRADRCNCLYPMTFLNFEIYARFIFFLANLQWKISFWFWRFNLTVPFYSSVLSRFSKPPVGRPPTFHERFSRNRKWTSMGESGQDSQSLVSLCPLFGFDFDPSEISLTGISGSIVCRFVPPPPGGNCIGRLKRGDVES